eukprot:g2218.t1
MSERSAQPRADPTTRTLRKEISPGMFLTRREDARDDFAVVYQLANDGDKHVYFTMDFWGSKNFRLLPLEGGARSENKRTKAHSTRAGLLRKVVVAPRSSMEVARLKVVRADLPSNLKVHYVWEASDDNSGLPPPAEGKPRRARELIADKVHLVTTRTDTKDGHTKFVYAIESTRRESIQITLDFSESENLEMRAGKRSFLARVFGGKKSANKNQLPALVKTLQLPAKTKAKTVATVRTVEPRKGWTLKHKISVGIRELVRHPLSDEAEENQEQAQISTEANCPVRQEEDVLQPEKAPTAATLPRNTRRESVMQIRSSHGFQSGFLESRPLPVPSATDPDQNGWSGKNDKRMSLRDSLSAARNSLSMLFDFVKPATGSGGKPLRPEALPQHEPSPPPYRMSWLNAEPAGAGGIDDDDGISLLAITEDCSAEGSNNDPSRISSTTAAASHSNLFELLSSLDLTCYHSKFVEQAMEDLALLRGLAEDSKGDFRQALKEDVGIEKFGHREAILRTVLSN